MRYGLLWGPQKLSQGITKVASFNNCKKLSRPAQKTAPSWSWASVLGPIQFTYAVSNRDTSFCEIIGVNPVGGDTDAIMTGKVQGDAVVLRGPVCRMLYRASSPESTYDVGDLQYLDDAEKYIYGCVLDIDRDTSQICDLLLVSWNDRGVAGLVLEKVSDSSFVRLGVFQDLNFGRELPKTEIRTITIR